MSLGKLFLCALTSSLDELELELELPSWLHLRATTWAEVSNIRTLLTQENVGWRGKKGERKVLLILCKCFCYSWFTLIRITCYCHVTASLEKQICSTHSVPVSWCQCKQWAASVCQYVSCTQLGYPALYISRGSVIKYIYSSTLFYFYFTKS